MSPDPQKMTFHELAMSWFDGSASDTQQAALWDLLLTDDAMAAEFANMARFESLLKQRMRAESKALLEFVALDCEMEDEVPLAPVVSVKKRWKPTPIQWVSLAAAVALLMAIAALWKPADGPDRLVVAKPTAAPSKESHTAAVTLVRARQDAAAPFVPEGQPLVAPSVAGLTLPERLEDFYLPEVKLDHVTFTEAANWLKAQVRELNFMKRADLDALEINVPAEAQKRTVTLYSGPISFSRAVSLISHLAVCDARITVSGIEISDRSSVANRQLASWKKMPSSVASPMTAEQVRDDAAAVGIELPANTVAYDQASGTTSVNATQWETDAIQSVAAARAQLAQLAPLSFIPMVLPSNYPKIDRVLTAAEVDTLKQQLAATGVTPPVVRVPRASAPPQRGEPISSPLVPSAPPRLILTSVPAGEVELLRIDHSGIFAGGASSTTINSGQTGSGRWPKRWHQYP